MLLGCSSTPVEPARALMPGDEQARAIACLLGANGKPYSAMRGRLKDAAGTSDFYYLVAFEMNPAATPPEENPPPPQPLPTPAPPSPTQPQPIQTATTQAVGGPMLHYMGNVLVYIMGTNGSAENEHVTTAATGTTFAVIPLTADSCTIMYLSKDKGHCVEITPKGDTIERLTECSYIDVQLGRDSANRPIARLVRPAKPFDLVAGPNQTNDPVHYLAWKTVMTLSTKAKIPHD